MYTLTAPVLGSHDHNLKEYSVADTMSDGLTFVYNDPSTDADDNAYDFNKYPVTVKIGDNELVQGTDYTVVLNHEFSTDSKKNDDGTYKKATFAIKLSDDILDEAKEIETGKTFYDFTEIVVTYYAQLNENAVIGSTGNTNLITLDYTNTPSDDSEKDDTTDPDDNDNVEEDGPSTTVYTFAIKVTKTDKDDNKVLKGAQFTLYEDDKETIAKIDGVDCVTESDADGFLEFKGLEAGKYYLKETQAPDGYNIDHTYYEIVIAEDVAANQSNYVVKDGEGEVLYTFTYDNVDTDDAETGYFEITITNVHLFMPITGGAGTLMLTIGGAALVLVGGALLLVLFRKKDTVEE